MPHRHTEVPEPGPLVIDTRDYAITLLVDPCGHANLIGSDHLPLSQVSNVLRQVADGLDSGNRVVRIN